MIDKKILWLGGAGAVAISVAIAITINVVIKSNPLDRPVQTTTPGQLPCNELQVAIDHLGRPGWQALPALITDNITWLRMQGDDCSVQGKDWSLANGQIKIKKQAQKTIIGNEGNILGGIK